MTYLPNTPWNILVFLLIFIASLLFLSEELPNVS